MTGPLVRSPAPTTCHYEGLDKLDKVFRGDQTFEFDQVFGPDSSQQELYTNIVKPIVEQVRALSLLFRPFFAPLLLLNGPADSLLMMDVCTCCIQLAH
jgi:hypothetical protein